LSEERQEFMTPPHYSGTVMDFLNICYAHQWVNRDFIAWPSRSLDLTYVNFYLLSYSKNIQSRVS